MRDGPLMRTTLDLDDDVLLAAKELAVMKQVNDLRDDPRTRDAAGRQPAGRPLRSGSHPPRSRRRLVRGPSSRRVGDGQRSGTEAPDNPESHTPSFVVAGRFLTTPHARRIDALESVAYRRPPNESKNQRVDYRGPTRTGHTRKALSLPTLPTAPLMRLANQPSEGKESKAELDQ